MNLETALSTLPVFLSLIHNALWAAQVVITSMIPISLPVMQMVPGNQEI